MSATKATLAELIPLLQRQTDQDFLQEGAKPHGGLEPPAGRVSTSLVIKTCERLIADDAVISLDCGANTHFAARNLMLRPGQN